MYIILHYVVVVYVYLYLFGIIYSPISQRLYSDPILLTVIDFLLRIKGSLIIYVLWLLVLSHTLIVVSSDLKVLDEMLNIDSPCQWGFSHCIDDIFRKMCRTFASSDQVYIDAYYQGISIPKSIT